MSRRRTGPLLTDHGRTVIAAALTVAAALAFAVMAEVARADAAPVALEETIR